MHTVEPRLSEMNDVRIQIRLVKSCWLWCLHWYNWRGKRVRRDSCNLWTRNKMNGWRYCFQKCLRLFRFAINDVKTYAKEEAKEFEEIQVTAEQRRRWSVGNAVRVSVWDWFTADFDDVNAVSVEEEKAGEERDCHIEFRQRWAGGKYWLFLYLRLIQSCWHWCHI